VDSTGMLASVKNPNQEQIRFCYSKDTEVYVVYRRWINSQNIIGPGTHSSASLQK